ncbi:very long chain fatty acid elongase 5-like [Periplaneta americana]|uniref:very long chain fatty acid elongase 5-like n=1 Tax=Periplaneta americana TaxID=6978 RepID=UPI0037E83887
MWMYHALKVVDLMETLFFILRKKNNQVSFLHVYHHAGMVLHTALYAKFGPGTHTVVAGSLNCLVHTVMYCYYFMTHMWPEYNHKLWWKKHVTHVQMFQFFLLMLQNLPTILWKDCQYPVILGGELFIQNCVLFTLFANFYVKAYLKKKSV